MDEFPLPGGIGVSHLRAYDWEAEDGVCGGSPHLHLACTEAYVVTGGRGAVQTLSVGGYAETPLEAGVIAWFAPGTVHRMVQGGGLRVTVLMQNSGLPEAGDAVFTFPPECSPTPPPTPTRRRCRKATTPLDNAVTWRFVVICRCGRRCWTAMPSR